MTEWCRKLQTHGIHRPPNRIARSLGLPVVGHVHLPDARVHVDERDLGCCQHDARRCGDTRLAWMDNYIGIIFRELEWKTPIFSKGAAPKTPNAYRSDGEPA